jgi:hypothetical protein
VTSCTARCVTAGVRAIAIVANLHIHGYVVLIDRLNAKWCFTRTVRIDREFGRSTNDLSRRLETWSVRFHLDIGRCVLHAARSSLAYFIRIEVARLLDPSHVRRQWDIFVIAEDMHGIFAWQCWPVANTCRTVAIVGAFDTRLRWTFDREA